MWFIAGLGIAAIAAARFFMRKPQAFEPPAPSWPPAAPPEPRPEDRAEELRRRIEESRTLLDERDEFEAAETPVDQADPQSRRREVHQRARDMVEKMRVADEETPS